MEHEQNKNEAPSDPESAMAKQLVLYADSIAAFAFIQSVALGYALWGKDLSSNIAKWSPCLLWGVVSLALLASLFYLLLILGCHAGEDSLLGKTRKRRNLRRWRVRVRYVRIATVILAAALMAFAFLFTWHTVHGTTPGAPGPGFWHLGLGVFFSFAS